ncbi:signal transduction histidine kinase [Antricoccus suffuscus]|uniref:histidine kinase n=1 Tax=Antricoccus suffuscus TaxID=1629062 RepID=A0A2T0Z8Q9_9ACTN|nr:histidine kinase [Antricoccus suffuscus]PRZ32739.1 signal transduction histidine kinase [Antricoccus suffuscus]
MGTTHALPQTAFWRRYWLDIALVIVAIAINAGALIGGSSADQIMTAVGSSFALLIFLGRRWQPLTVSLLAFAVLAVGSTFSRELTSGQFFGILITFCLVGAVNRERDAVIGWAGGVLAIGFVSAGDPHGTWADFALTASICTIIWAAGLIVSRRSRNVVAAEARAFEAERSRALHAAQAAAHERARIATELHDIVSHSLSIVIVQTVAARSTLTDIAGAEDSRQVLERRLAAIEETSREALQDMRRMLGLIQQPPLAVDLDGAERTAPSPDLQHVAQLISRAKSAGLTIDAAAIDPGIHLSSGLALTTYRIVQESLTNAIKHAPESRVRVAVQQVDGQLAIDITNGPGHPSQALDLGAGQGLIGVRQRTELYGGRCVTRATTDGGFEVSVTLPLDHESAPVTRPEPLESSP